MNWVLGIVGALFGAALAESRNLLGAVVGFLLVFLLMGMNQLRQRLAAQERELQALRQRLASTTGPAPATPSPAAPTAGPAPVPPAVPTAPATVREAAPTPARESAVLPEPSMSAEPAPASAVVTAKLPAATPPPIPPRRRPEPVVEDGWVEDLFGKIKRWFTEGNVPVKIGVLVLFAGVAAALRYAAMQGYFTFPIEARLIVIAVAALAGLAFGWRQREEKPAFGLSLQGGALGVLLLTVFATYKLYGLLPPMLAFALVVVLVAGAALLSVLQRNMWLAVLGFLGGYLAPVLISTGSANHIGLFTYYAVLNAAVFAISWKQAWRLLNLIGFGFTFGVGAAWGATYYRPELFSTVEPFLVLFFLFYIVIGLLYVTKQTEHRRPWVDGTLVFGTPLVAFPLQAGMLKDDRFALAFSAIGVAAIYAGLVWWLRQRKGERLLSEAYAALALGFATLAVPLAFSAGTTASVWALEGAGVAWIGLRQNRLFPWISGLVLQLLAAGSYVINVLDSPPPMDQAQLLLNSLWLGAAILAIGGYLLSLIHDRHRPRFGLPALLFVWATFWWTIAALSQFGIAERSFGAWQYLMIALAASVALAAVLRDRLPWPRMNWLVLYGAMLGLPMVFWAGDEFGAPLQVAGLGFWVAYVVALAWALWSAPETPARSLSLAHLFGLWTFAIAVSMQSEHVADTLVLAEGWAFVAVVAPLALMTLGLWRRPDIFAWPRGDRFEKYAIGWFVLAVPLLALVCAGSLFIAGDPAPLPFVPVLNPLELATLAIAVMLYAMAGSAGGMFASWQRLWPFAGFAIVSMMTLRAVHFWHGDAWDPRILHSGVSQAALAVVWSLLGVGSMLLGSRRLNRALWMAGMALMLIVCAKLVLVDRQYMGNIPGIVSFLAVGLLLVGVGYFAPSPPKDSEGETA